MAFSSIPFLCVFFPVVILLYYVIPFMKIKNLLLTAASLLFYAYGEGVYVLLMLACAFSNYLFARLLARGGGMKKAFLVAAVVTNLGMLGVYKYAGMVVATVNQLAGTAVPVPEIRLPVGISFFTFQALSYVIDVYRGTVEADKSFSRILLYISFFPQLIAGPIVKYRAVAGQLDSRKAAPEEICRGMRRFIAGLSKKVLLSNTLGAGADYVFSLRPDELGMLVAWLGAAAYMLQIYFDFSGYSDMAIGMGKMFGFDLPENFRAPYTAASIQDFWRRWHISLTDWFREYLYIPLGGNRKGKIRTWLNRLTVFFFTGLWHGANWTFVLWGLFHGVLFTLETVLPNRNRSGKKSWWRHVYVLLAVCVGFVIFRADTVGQAAVVLKAMFTKYEWNPHIAAATMAVCNRLFLFVLPIAVACCLPVGACLEEVRRRRPFGTACAAFCSGVSYVSSFFLLMACVMSLAGGTYNPFIYFRF